MEGRNAYLRLRDSDDATKAAALELVNGCHPCESLDSHFAHRLAVAQKPSSTALRNLLILWLHYPKESAPQKHPVFGQVNVRSSQLLWSVACRFALRRQLGADHYLAAASRLRNWEE